MSNVQERYTEYGTILTGLGDELDTIKHVCYVASEEFFLELFESNNVNWDEQVFQEFCDHMAYNLMMYYINSHVDEYDSPISTQYKIQQIAKSINSETLKSYYCEFMMYSMIFNKKAMNQLSEMAASAMNLDN